MESYLKISNSYNVSSRPTAWDPHPQMNLRQFGAALINKYNAMHYTALYFVSHVHHVQDVPSLHLNVKRFLTII